MVERGSDFLNIPYIDLCNDQILCTTSLLASNIPQCLQFLRLSEMFTIDSLSALLKVWKLSFFHFAKSFTTYPFIV